jgi:hypothetical protein
MEIIINEDDIIFKIKNNVPENNLIPFYTPEYFKFIGVHPEIFISGTKIESDGVIKTKMVGGYFQDDNLLTIPYKYFVYLIEKNPISTRIKTVKLPNFPIIPKPIPKEPIATPTPQKKEPINSSFIQTLFKKTQEPITEPTKPTQPTQPTEPTQPTQPQHTEPTPVERVEDEIILRFIKTEDTTMNGMNLSEIMSSRDPTEIDVTLNGLTYQEVLNIKRVEDYVSSKKKDIFEEDIFYINGKWIIIHSNSIGKYKMNLDISQMENTELVKKYHKI